MRINTSIDTMLKFDVDANVDFDAKCDRTFTITPLTSRKLMCKSFESKLFIISGVCCNIAMIAVINFGEKKHACCNRTR